MRTTESGRLTIDCDADDGSNFRSAVDLIHHCNTAAAANGGPMAGDVGRPLVPCLRPEGVVPMAWPGVAMVELETRMLAKAQSVGIVVRR